MHRRAFTLIELLVVISIIALLIALLVPSFKKARAQAWEVRCRSNLHQVHVAIEMYANGNSGWYPLEPTEINPHAGLIKALRATESGLIHAMYCPRADQIEPSARDAASYPPKGQSTSVVDTPENHELGNIGYFYWSMRDRSKWRSTNHKKYDEPMDAFRPRWLRNGGKPVPQQPTDEKTPCALQDYRPGEYWALSDFFRKGAPFPHTREHKRGLNVLYLDGHGAWMVGQPRANFK